MATITLPAGSTSSDLQTAIDGASSNDIIELSGNMDSSDTVTIPTGFSITVQSNSGNSWKIKQTVIGRHFNVLGALTLENIVLDGDALDITAGTKGGLLVQGSLALAEGAVIQACYSSADGGAVLLDGGSMSMQDGSVIQGNTAQSLGGGIYVGTGSSVQMTGGTIVSNQVRFDSGAGAGVLIFAGSYFEMSGGLITENSLNLTGNQGGAGGGVSLRGGEFVMSAGIISYNKSKQYGAGVSIGASGTVTMTGGLIEYNTAGTAGSDNNLSGGGVAVISGVFNMSGGTISHNEAVFGGGVHLGYTTTICNFNMSGGVIEDNFASAYGGGIQTQSQTAAVNIRRTDDFDNIPLIRSNRSALYGGGILVRGSSSFTMDIGEILNNSAVNGGGLWVDNSGTINISGASSIMNNTAAGSGGGIYTEDFSYDSPAVLTAYQNIVTAQDTLFGGNRASQAYYPPSSAGDFTNIGYETTSIVISGEYVHPLNNYDINYIGPDPLTVLFTVTYNANGGVGSFVDTDIEDGTLYTVLSLEQTGISRRDYIFVGWNTQPDGGGIYYEPGDQFTITANVQLYAQWTLIEGPYDVIYDANGGVGSYGDIGIPNSTVYTVLSPDQAGISRTDYTFVEWNAQPDGSGAPYQPGDTIVITGNVVLYAQWTLIQGPYDVTYDANGGDGSYADTGLPRGTIYTVLSPEQAGISRTDYIFSGWNTLPDGNGIYYEPGDEFTITDNVVLYAQWTLVQGPYIVIYDANAGTGSYADTELLNGTVYTVLSPEQTGISRMGYNFTGWNTQPDGSGTPYQPGDTIVITGNVILYAQWALIEEPYTVIYDANCGDGSYADNGIPSGTVYTILSPEQTGISRTGYNFTGWNTQPDGSGTTYQPGETIVITGNVTLYAQWTLLELPCCDCMCCCCCDYTYYRRRHRPRCCSSGWWGWGNC